MHHHPILGREGRGGSCACLPSASPFILGKPLQSLPSRDQRIPSGQRSRGGGGWPAALSGPPGRHPGRGTRGALPQGCPAPRHRWKRSGSPQPREGGREGGRSCWGKSREAKRGVGGASPKNSGSCKGQKNRVAPSCAPELGAAQMGATPGLRATRLHRQAQEGGGRGREPGGEPASPAVELRAPLGLRGLAKAGFSGDERGSVNPAKPRGGRRARPVPPT